MTQKIGAVLVVGGGIGGMQASLDLAEQGFKVYLVEKEPSIGGRMPQLDKTFPTNDCAMCTLAPRLVEIGGHPNIEIITYAELNGLIGTAGNFKATVKRLPSYVDFAKCTGCSECEKVCPIEVKSEFNEGLDNRHAIYRLYPQAIPNVFVIDKKKEKSPCRLACPAGCNNQAYIALIAQGKFKEALEVIRERIPLPAICGRVCNAPCEDNCNRKQLGGALSIRDLKRFVADYEMKGLMPQEVKQEVNRGEKVAVIGSGPCGLTCAYDLAKMGYSVTVFEALPVAGGMLRVGIPKYRLPHEVIDYEIELIKKQGVEILTNTPLGPDLTLKDLFQKGYKSIFIAIGTHKSRRLNIEGEDLDGVIGSLGFLHGVKNDRKFEIKDKTVAVIGGGNVAVDAARTALRCGAKSSSIIYRRSKEEMLVNETELLDVENEGIEIHYLLAPTKILGEEGKVSGIECTPMKLGELDKTGRRIPIPDASKEKIIVKVDIIIPAIGQSSDLSSLATEDVEELEVTSEGIKPKWGIPYLEGAEFTGVYGFTDFLQAVARGERVDIGEDVLVIGGGNVAIDVARTCIRLGRKNVHLVCLESKSEMPAYKYEIEEAEAEGVIFHNRKGPKRILGKENKVVGLETIECVSVFDEEKRFNPIFKEEAIEIIAGDTVIIAIGQLADYKLLRAADGILITEKGFIRVDKITLATNLPGVFAGGDVVGIGPALVVDAINQGHEAAMSIDKYIRGVDIKEGRQKKEETKGTGIPENRVIELKPREQMPKLKVDERIKDFEEVELGFTVEQAINEAKRCLACSGCSECQRCVSVCNASAINHQMQEEIVELNVGAVILSPGYDKFEAEIRGEYGYGRYKNVVTSLQFERILSASGPFGGHLQRLSDGKEPKKVAWIQCVGSRDPNKGNPYCSSVCCTYAVKEAIIAREHSAEELETAIFYMDMRTFGKGFEEYCNRARDEYGVRFVRSRVAEIREVEATKNLVLRYEDEKEDKVVEEEFDLVVLSVGLTPKSGTKEIANRLGIELNEYGFCQTAEFSPFSTNVPGVYAAGVFQEPKDIPETVMQASASAAQAGALLSESRGSLIIQKEYPPEIDVLGQPPRIGVFVCHCGINIGGVVDVPGVAEYTKGLPDVFYAEDNLFTCSQDTQRGIIEKIKEYNLNRVVVASCTPRTHEPLFRQTIRQAGLNPYLFEMANIRDQCSWVHQHEPQKATQKAKDLVRMALAKARLIEPLYPAKMAVTQRALIIGGGLSGMVASLCLAEQGFEVELVEREKELGGNLRHIHFTLEGNNPQEYLKSLREQVENHRLIKVHLESEVTAVSGHVGHFVSGVRCQVSGVREIEHGVVIIATGGVESRPSEYLYGQDERVITQRELEQRLTDNRLPITDNPSVIMIQCVGSREKDRPYCSRVCCQQAIKNALVIKEKNPTSEVYILYRDIRTYGFREDYYCQAREAGVIFIRYELDKKPEVRGQSDLSDRSDLSDSSPLKVAVFDPILGEDLVLPADMVVLSPSIIPQEANRQLSQLLKAPLDANGFFLEAHMKLRPVESATDGVYLCGLAHSPKTIDEAISQANAAASRAATILSKKELELEAALSFVVDENCDGCAYCIDPCPYKAITLIEYMKDGAIKKTVEVDESKCKGCGTCMATCPKKGIYVKHFKMEMFAAMVEAALQSEGRG